MTNNVVVDAWSLCLAACLFELIRIRASTEFDNRGLKWRPFLMPLISHFSYIISDDNRMINKVID